MDKDITIYYDIIKTVRTTEEQSILLNTIDLLVKELYRNQPVTAALITKLFGENTGGIVQASLGARGILLSDISGVKSFFSDLSDYVRGAQVIHATVAVPPEESMLEIFAEWLQRTFPQQPVVFEVKHDIAIVAGIQLDYKGKYWDYSLKQQVTKVFKEKKDELFGV
jgi:F0F1-type ATP synthase delta subunit